MLQSDEFLTNKTFPDLKGHAPSTIRKNEIVPRQNTASFSAFQAGIHMVTIT